MALNADKNAEGWESIAHEIGLWTIGSKLRGGLPHRTCALRLKSKGFLIIGPSATMSRRGLAELKRMGRIEFVLAVNHFNTEGIKAFCKEYPEAIPVSSKQARDRLIAKSGLELHGLDKLRSQMPGPGMLHMPAGLTSGECWVRVSMRRGKGWIVGEAFNNIVDLPGGLTGLMLKLTASAPGLKIGRSFLSKSVSDVGVYRAWLFNRLREDRPSTLIPSRGSVITHADLATRIKHVVDDRLGST